MDWISVEDETPPIHTRVLILVNGRVDIGFYDIGPNDVEFFYDKRDYSMFFHVTHWMKLPRVPE